MDESDESLYVHTVKPSAIRTTPFNFDEYRVGGDNNRDAKAALIECISRYNHLFMNTAEYYAPYFSIVQSSGYGKTRLALQVVKERFHGFYICLREDLQKSSTDHQPPRTAAVADSIYFNSSSNEKYVASLIVPRFKRFFDLLFECAQTFPTSLELFEAQQVGNVEANNVFWTKVLGAEFSDSKAATTKVDPSLFPILIVIDDARGLRGVDDATTTSTASSMYNGLRRALAETTGFLCILIDSSTKICSPAPMLKDDPSARICYG